MKKYLPQCKTVIAAATGASADILVRHGDIIRFGRHNLEVRATPGHTHGKVIDNRQVGSPLNDLKLHLLFQVA